MADDLEPRMTRLEHAIWGVRGDNGMVSDIRTIREWIEKESDRRDSEVRDRINGQRAVILALLAAVVALMGTVASLVGVGVL